MKLSIATLLCIIVGLTQAQTKETRLVVDASNVRTTINKNIYGQFSEHLGNGIYGGIWVGADSTIPNTNGIRNDVVAALKQIKVPVLRWPGGCFADEYHWMNGIGPRDKRPSMINTNWGGVTEDNSFGTHEYMELCRQLGCDPYITGNVGSGTVQELAQWVEYMNSDNVSPMTELRKKNGRDSSWGVRYWGLGNESWGCGGNMRPEFYADQVRRYGTYCRDYGKNKLFKIACGPGGDDYQWTETLMKNAGGYISGLSLHYYAFGDGKPATDFNENGWFDIMKKTLMMQTYVTKNDSIMDKYDPYKKIALIVDEWGTWHGVEPGTNPGFLYQQNTMRDAIAAACNLNIFNNHADRIRMANIAQTVNVLQAMVLTKGKKMIVTPTYYVFDMFKVHQNAYLVHSDIEPSQYIFGDQRLPAVNCSASLDDSGRMHISLCNIDPTSEQHVACDLKKFIAYHASGEILTSKEMNAHNSFDDPTAVEPQKFSNFTVSERNLSITLPPMSVVVLELEGKHELPPPLEIKNPQPGVMYDYYEGTWETIPAFAQLTPKRTGTASEFAIPDENSGENFGLQYSGYIKIPTDGSYTFFLNSDDGSDLVIDDDIITDDDGRHAPQEESGTTMLHSGFHRITVRFFQAGGGKVLDVSISGPGIAKQIIPAKMLFH